MKPGNRLFRAAVPSPTVKVLENVRGTTVNSPLSLRKRVNFLISRKLWFLIS
ncbi:hypothetical protein HNQ80_002263 [Anaerosolibacter carboniphilus]|uniref:Uncharacterized protein n=1 Tax=Anaerosolibacter carboniphilus TaxID=1417629 RepID=A0A841KQZ2_9FIRM|nr:hypothetical protein [Anaerosolibacter carboniphilus]